MKPLAFNLRDARKVGGDKHSSTFELKGGHKITVAHAPLPALQRKQLEKLPVHLADGDPSVGSIVDRFTKDQYPNGTPDNPNANENQGQGPTVDAANAANSADSMAPTAPAPDSTAPASAPTPQPSGVDYNAAYQQGQQGINEAQQAAEQNAAANAVTLQSDADSRKQLNDSFNANISHISDNQQKYMNDYAAGHIDKNAYLKDMGTGQKVLTAIGLLLGGFSGGFNHTGVNPAANWLSDQQNKDIAAQQADIDKRKTLLGANQDLYKDAILGQQATRMNMNDMLDHQIQIQAAKTGSLQAKAIADQAHSQFAMQNGQLLQSMAMRKTLQDATSNSNGQPLPVDPSSFVKYMVQDPAQQKQVYEEIGRAQNVSQNQQKILQAFDDATNENTVLRTGAGMLRTPGSAMALHQLLLPNFKQIDGTVRQAAMDETFHNVTPAPGDAQHKIDQKRQALVDWMHSETAAPVAKGNGIDLSKFKSTAPPAPPPEIKISNGIKYMRGPNGEAIPVK